MPVSLKWIDYDSGAHQRAQRILALFSERETRDELGFASVRDAISDSLFPGTSVLHTRLRYVLFIPWMYDALERAGTRASRIAVRARDAEIQLIECLLETCPDEYGIIGRDAGKSLKRLPSSVYWAALGAWGLRVYPGSQGQYHGDMDFILTNRRRLRDRRAAAIEEGDDVGGLWDLAGYTWHPGLPQAPESFPNDADFQLTREEARFIQERIKQAFPDSLMAHLALKPRRVDCRYVWEHPDQADFSGTHRELVIHAHNFSFMMFGAALLYNLMLAQLLEREELVEGFRNRIADWVDRLKARLDELRGWHGQFDTFWTAVTAGGHEISPRTMRFVDHWIELVLSHREGVFANHEARNLVKEREIEKKKANSRFTNKRMQEQWSGSSGLYFLDYRWPVVQSHVNDLAAAIRDH